MSFGSVSAKPRVFRKARGQKNDIPRLHFHCPGCLYSLLASKGSARQTSLDEKMNFRDVVSCIWQVKNERKQARRAKTAAGLVSTAGWAEAKGEKSNPGRRNWQPGLYRPPDGRKLKGRKASVTTNGCIPEARKRLLRMHLAVGTTRQDRISIETTPPAPKKRLHKPSIFQKSK